KLSGHGAKGAVFDARDLARALLVTCRVFNACESAVHLIEAQDPVGVRPPLYVRTVLPGAAPFANFYLCEGLLWLKLEGILQMQERIQLKNDFRLVAQRTFLPVAFCIADSEPLIIPNSYGFFPLVSGQPSKGVITLHPVTPVIRNLKFRPQ